MTMIRVERDGYGASKVRLGAAESPEHAARRLRSLYPDVRALALVVSSPYGSRVERYL